MLTQKHKSGSELALKPAILRQKPVKNDIPDLPPPNRLGAPQKFVQWRPGQMESVVRSLDATTRFVLHCHPVGSGKTLTYMMEGLLGGKDIRMLILTATRGLEDQLMDDFSTIGLVDIRGRRNYSCLALEEGGELREELGVEGSGWTAEDGPCRDGVVCSLKEQGCPYFDALRAARKARLVVSNYAKWMTLATEESGALGTFDILVCDEAHDSPDQVCSYLTVELSREEVLIATSRDQWKRLEATRSIEDWRSEALGLLAKMVDRDTAGMRPRKRREWKRLERKFKRLVGLRGDWVTEVVGEKISVTPVWPRSHAEGVLFRRIPKVILSSATVRVKTAELLGVEMQDLTVIETVSNFPAERRPIYWIETGVDMNHRVTDDQLAWWMGKVDKWIAARQDRRGIVHSISYALRNFITVASRHRARFITHNSSDTAHAVQRYCEQYPPFKFLLSPAVTTGYNFPYELCEWGVICKIPWPDTRSAVMKVRCKQDKDYAPYVACQNLDQMVGRGMREEDDQCETGIFDDKAKWFIPKYKKFMTASFMSAYQGGVKLIPRPLEKLERREQ